MVEDYYPVEWPGRQVVALPEHIGISNAGQVREELLSAINRGAQGLIADMTATISCDHASADAGHTAYAGMRQVKGGNASSAKALTHRAPENARRSARSDLDVTDQQTIGAAVQALLTAEVRLYEHSVHIT